jgi:hypothetical protein
MRHAHVKDLRLAQPALDIAALLEIHIVFAVSFQSKIGHAIDHHCARKLLITIAL